MTYKELTVSSDIPVLKVRKAHKTGLLSLAASELKGSGALLHLHPEPHAKALKARKAGKGTRLHITHHEIKYPIERQIGGSIWSRIWDGTKSGFKAAKDSGILSKLADAAVAPLSGLAPEFAPAITAARAGLKASTGIGFKEDLFEHGKKALKYAKDHGHLTKSVDKAEQLAVSKLNDDDHKEIVHLARRHLRKKTGIGMPSGRKFAKGSPEAKEHMAKLRAMRKGGSFRL